ncbi:MAG: hypothetical protein ABEL51_15725, partial [Salinibacter sp.]
RRAMPGDYDLVDLHPHPAQNYCDARYVLPDGPGEGEFLRLTLDEDGIYVAVEDRHGGEVWGHGIEPGQILNVAGTWERVAKAMGHKRQLEDDDA